MSLLYLFGYTDARLTYYYMSDKKLSNLELLKCVLIAEGEGVDVTDLFILASNRMSNYYKVLNLGNDVNSLPDDLWEIYKAYPVFLTVDCVLGKDNAENYFEGCKGFLDVDTDRILYNKFDFGARKVDFSEITEIKYNEIENLEIIGVFFDALTYKCIGYTYDVHNLKSYVFALRKDGYVMCSKIVIRRSKDDKMYFDSVSGTKIKDSPHWGRDVLILDKEFKQDYLAKHVLL